jgi:hypothetical protein
MTFITSP